MIKYVAASAALLGAALVMACGGSDSKSATSSTQAPAGQGQSSLGQASQGQPAAQGQPSPAATAAAAASGGGATGKLDPCALLTKADAEVLAGAPVKDGEAKDSGNPLGQQLCGYAAVSDRSSRLVQISVATDGGMTEAMRKSGYTVKRLYTDTKSGNAAAQPVSGVGEDAFMGGFTGLHVLQKDVYFSISVTGGIIGGTDKPVTTETLSTAARAVLGRLPK